MLGNCVNQWLLIINFLCLNYDEFLAIFSNDFVSCYPGILVFVDFFSSWALFLPFMFLLMHLDDREHDSKLSQKERFKNKFICNGVVALNVIVSFGTLFLWIILGINYSFDSSIVFLFGDICGVISTVLESIEYIPQFITVCKLKNSGSLSLPMLAILGPTELACGVYMYFIGENWSTYLCSFVSAIAQISLLVVCLFFTLFKKKAKKTLDFSEITRRVFSDYNSPLI